MFAHINVSVLSFKIFFINLERAIYTFLWAELTDGGTETQT